MFEPRETRRRALHFGHLFPAMAGLGLPGLVRGASYPSTRQLSSWQSVGTLLAKCARKARVHHIGSLTDDTGLAFTLGTALPKATNLGTYSWRVRRDSNCKLLSGLVAVLRQLGLATGEAGFNCDFRAIRHHGTDAVLEKHYVPRRSQRTRAVLTFFAGPRQRRDGLRQRQPPEPPPRPHRRRLRRPPDADPWWDGRTLRFRFPPR